MVALLGTVIVGVIVGLVAVFGRRVLAATDRERLEVLRRLDGRVVTLGIGTRFIVPQTGTLTVGDSRFSVTFRNGGRRAVPLADIRWVADAQTGDAIGGPW